MAVPPIVSKLVETFDRNIDNFKSQTYNETQVRQQFINPFFEALGWDMQNKAGIALAYSDVIHEDAIKVSGSTKAPDYCFRIGGTRKFFLEAKKPSVDIKSDVSPAYQLRRYAWSAKLPLSILTDFEEFAVYDCQIRPNVNDKPSTARIFFCSYKEYGDKWEQIANIFSKEAVLKGLFDKYASEKTSKRGTTTVDKEFLAEIEGWRDELAKNIAIRNGKLSVYDLNFAVQKTIDRILFLRICEDRGIERSEQLLGLINGSRIYPRLFELFEKADERYNSGIFHFRREKDRPESPDELSANLKVDDDVLKKILKDLYYPHSPYEFSVMPAEILGNVYEQFLGKVIRLTVSHQAKVEEKPEVKKAGGVYYTPSYIVDYIVKNTVGKLCQGKTPKQIEKLKILDPACGSGSFLIGAYQYLLDFHRDYYAKEPSKHKKQIYQGKGGQWFLTIDEKKRILLNNIYGVDIDSQAVEVTKLSLLLKVLENETQESLRLFHERALPDLGNNIKCGNSLIGPDFYQNQQLTLFGDEQQRKINAFDWQKEFVDILGGKNSGFDAVIGNPPWGSLITPPEKEYFRRNYVNRRGEAESHLFFIERARLLLNNLGIVGFVTPNTWLTVLNSQEIRHYLLQNATFYEICQLSKYIFKDAPDIVPILLFLGKKNPKTQNCIVKTTKEIRINPSNFHEAFTTEQISPNIWLNCKGCSINLFATFSTLRIIEKCNAVSVPLSKICEVLYGIKTGNNKKFLSTTKTDKHKCKALKTGEMVRYNITWKNLYLWWCSDLAGYRRASVDIPKIIIQYIRKISLSKRIIAAMDADGSYYPLNNYSYVISKDTNYSLAFILGILDSSLINYYFANQFVDYNIKPTYLQQLPIRTIDFKKQKEKANHDKMVTLVEEMLELHKKISKIKNPNEKTRLQRQIDATDAQIDNLVYDLYGLKEEEIKIVEGSK
jgi:type I restriction-modification system DNA methylase subunit